MEKISRKELKFVTGGFMQPPATCTAKCANGTTVSCEGPNCTANDADKYGNGTCSGSGKENNC